MLTHPTTAQAPDPVISAAVPPDLYLLRLDAAPFLKRTDRDPLLRADLLLTLSILGLVLVGVAAALLWFVLTGGQRYVTLTVAVIDRTSSDGVYRLFLDQSSYPQLPEFIAVDSVSYDVPPNQPVTVVYDTRQNQTRLSSQFYGPDQAETQRWETMALIGYGAASLALVVYSLAYGIRTSTLTPLNTLVISVAGPLILWFLVLFMPFYGLYMVYRGVRFRGAQVLYGTIADIEIPLPSEDDSQQNDSWIIKYQFTAPDATLIAGRHVTISQMSKQPAQRRPRVGQAVAVVYRSPRRYQMV